MSTKNLVRSVIQLEGGKNSSMVKALDNANKFGASVATKKISKKR